MKILFVLFSFTLISKIIGQQTLNAVDNKTIEINKIYNGSLKDGMVQSYSFMREQGQTIRIKTVLTNTPSDIAYPLLISVEQRYSILSWTLPLNLSKFTGIGYTQVSRTLCSDHVNESPRVTIWVLTSSTISINYTLQVTIVPDFNLIPNNSVNPTTVNISDGSPQYFRVSFPQNASSDIIRVTLSSANSSCVVASLQPAECPVDDLLSTVDYRGVYLTFNKTADIIIDRNADGKGRDHYLVLVSAPDGKCSNSESDTVDAEQISLTKTVDIMVRLELASWDYWRPVVILLVLLLLPFFVLIPLFIVETIVVYRSKALERNWPFIFYTPKLSNIVKYDNDISFEFLGCCREFIGNYRPGSSNQTTPLLSNKQVGNDEFLGGRPDSSLLSVDLPKNASPLDVNSYIEDPSIPLSFKSLSAGVVGMSKGEMKLKYNQDNFYLHDLSRKHDIYLWKKYLLYLTSVITVTMFYALPAVQVAVFRVLLYRNGDNDLCYFNFKCSHTLGEAVSFNNIWSNVAYLVLGVAFILLTGVKQFLRSQMLKKSEKEAIQEYKERGITPYFGIYYALGFALISEGLMSSIYHTCPSGINFQFDSSFMFIISTLCILKLYQNRHPDISVGAASTFMLLGSLIILTAFGLLAGNQDFLLVRTIYALIVIGITSFICIHIYFFSHPTLFWHAICDTIKARRWHVLQSSCKNICFPPVNRARILHIIILCIVNGVCLTGLFYYKLDAATALLFFIISNLVIYMVYYWGMKILYCEFKNRPFVFLFSTFLSVVAIVFFLTALYFFFSSVTNWQLSASMSRMLNHDCIFLGFYDSHDIWHILSSFGLFFNFLFITMIDDNISDIPKSKIRVF